MHDARHRAELMKRVAGWVLAALLAAPLAHAADPIVIAHRGASGYLPEHTLAGYELAVRLGADFIEPDLQLTSDAELVAIHDDSLQRTTNVAALFAQRKGGFKVGDFTLAEIRTLTVQPTGTASTTYPGFTPAHPALQVPTFDEVIALAKAQGRAVGIYPEAKQADPLMEDKIIGALQRSGYGEAPDAVFVQSFSEATVRSLDVKLRAVGLEVPLVLLGTAVVLPDGTARLGVRGGAQLSLDEVATFCEGIGVNIGNKNLPVTSSFIDQAHAAGLQVHGWTFAQRDAALAANEYRQFLEMGLDGMFSNYADQAVAARKLFLAR